MSVYLFKPEPILASQVLSSTSAYSAEYGASRMFYGSPRWPAKSAATSAAWGAVLDAGAGKVFAVDTLCAWSNTYHVHLFLNSTNVWTAPPWNLAAFKYRHSFTAGQYSVAGNKITLLGGRTVGPVRLLSVRFQSSGNIYYVERCTASEMWCNASVAAESGTCDVIAARAWATGARGEYRYAYIWINGQNTIAGHYILNSVAFGLRNTLAWQHQTMPPDTRINAVDIIGDSGQIGRTRRGPVRRAWDLDLTLMQSAEMQTIRDVVTSADAMPLALIPDSNDAADWALVQPDLENSWSPEVTTVRLTEVS